MTIAHALKPWRNVPVPVPPQPLRAGPYLPPVDGCVPYVGTEEWTSELGFPETENWRPWMAGTNQNASAHICAGYVTNYNAGLHNFTFITIKGAGW